VQCGGIEVRPGNYVVADEDGIAIGPKECYAEVVVVAEKSEAQSRRCIS